MVAMLQVEVYRKADKPFKQPQRDRPRPSVALGGGECRVTMLQSEAGDLIGECWVRLGGVVLELTSNS